MSSIEMSSMVATVGSEVTVYGAVGAVFLFLLVALLLGLSFSSPCKAGDDGKYLSNSNLGYDRDQVIIYKNDVENLIIHLVILDGTCYSDGLQLFDGRLCRMGSVDDGIDTNSAAGHLHRTVGPRHRRR